MQNLMEISFDYYKVFYEVARSHSITLAASRLCLTQPTVTKYIQNLEAALGCQLFVRSQKGVSMTEEGQRLFRQISHPCQQMGQAQEIIREYTTNQNGKITISATELTMRYFLLPFLERTLSAPFSQCKASDPRALFSCYDGLSERRNSRFCPEYHTP